MCTRALCGGAGTCSHLVGERGAPLSPFTLYFHNRFPTTAAQGGRLQTKQLLDPHLRPTFCILF